MSPARHVEALLHEEIPLTRALGVRASACDGEPAVAFSGRYVVHG